MPIMQNFAFLTNFFATKTLRPKELILCALEPLWLVFGCGLCRAVNSVVKIFKPSAAADTERHGVWLRRWDAPCLLAMTLFLSCSVKAQIYSYYDKHKEAYVYTNMPSNQNVEERGASKAVGKKVEKKADQTKEAKPAAEPLYEIGLATQYDELIKKYSDLHKVDSKLIKAVIKAESNFNPRAVSPKGAKGLMQLMPETAARFGVRNIFDPEENIQIGVKYLRYLLDLFKTDLKLSLAAYNAGENIVQKLQGIPQYKETLSYVKRVVSLYGSDLHLYPDSNYAWSYKFYTYRSEDGVLHLTNIDPPRGSFR